jgi:hypothetical protein
VKLLAAMLALSLVGCASQHGIPNFQEVAPGFACGGQPTAAGWTWLTSHGYYTRDIKLNPETPELGDGMEVIDCPITTQQQIWGPVGPQLEKAVAAIRPGTFLHCEMGMNRTRTVVILYRMRVCHWNKERAVAEAVRYGWETSFPALLKYVGDE